ncbi:odorant receptor 67d-like [Calliphora vicina]|uniref:odorant receptor 67d-like n=1 Tax=Calliphora vicina TaxID=7373 RepID=UPI00325AD99F
MTNSLHHHHHRHHQQRQQQQQQWRHLRISNIFTVGFVQTELVQVLHSSIQLKVMAKSCFDRYNKIVGITRTMAALVGADVVDPNYKMNILTWTVILAINAFFVCTIYTIYVGLVVDKDWKVVLQTLSLVGSAVQGYSKLILCIYRRLVISSMNKKLDNIYLEYQKDKDYLETLRYRTDLATKMLKIVLWIYVIPASTIIVYPLIYSMLYNKKVFVMQFLLPGIDPLTHFGYVLHNVFHVILICLGAFGNFASDMYIFIFIINIPLLKDILRIKCEKLNRIALKARDPTKTMPVVKEIVEWHQNYNTFAQQVEEVYYGVIFVQVFTSVVSICCTLFSIVIRSWPAAFAYLLYSVVMMYAYCALGNLVEISNDEVIDIIYCDCLWYELSVPEQKLILLMIRKAQKPLTLTIGQIMPLSMNTALQLTKAIYSYMMVLLNFLETDDI